FGFYGNVDLLSIAPFFLALIFIGFGFDLRALRALRLLRLARLFKLTRYTAAIDRMAAAWRAVKQEIVAFSITAVIVLYVCALVIYQCEHDAQPQVFASVFDAMWWAAVT
ncbi:ion transporter, partial [Rhizobiaceae sp. 2RAB30]